MTGSSVCVNYYTRAQIDAAYRLEAHYVRNKIKLVFEDGKDEVQPNQEQSQTNFHLLSKREIMRWADGEQKHTMFLCGLFVSFSAKNSVVSQNIEYNYTRRRVFLFSTRCRTFYPQKDKNL